MIKVLRPSIAVLSIALAMLSAVMLEREGRGLAIEDTVLAGSPVTLYRPDGPAPLVVVAHGYAGSRQMMRALSLTLARSGMAVANVDLLGHGRHERPMTGDITRIDGATATLVAQIEAVARQALKLPGIDGPVSLLGHSMATDVVIRAAVSLDASAVVALSTYSDAVVPTAPKRLLLISGEREARLREVSLGFVRQIDPAAVEGETAARGPILRRTIAARGVGHVGVLYHPRTKAEARAWLSAAAGIEPAGTLPRTAIWTALLLGALLTLAWPLAGGLGRPARRPPLAPRTVLFAMVVPVLPAFGAAVLLPPAALGLSAFGGVAAFLGAWGVAQSAVLWRAGLRLGPFSIAAFAMLLGWSLLFALALDRYGAAFVPVGPKGPILAILLLATIPFAVADMLLARHLIWWQRIVARAVPVLTLLGAMFAAPGLGTAFTVLPVMVLYWLIYGTVAGWTLRRAGPAAAAVAMGVVLAWAIASSTPLIAV